MTRNQTCRVGSRAPGLNGSIGETGRKSIGRSCVTTGRSDSGNLRRHLANEAEFRRERLRIGSRPASAAGARPLLRDVKRRREIEDRLAVLDRRDAPRREARAVAQTIDEIDDRRLEVAGEDEVAVRRVRLALALDRAARRDQRLREDLPTEDAPRAEVAVLPAVDIDLERLEVEQGEEGDVGF